MLLIFDDAECHSSPRVQASHRAAATRTLRSVLEHCELHSRHAALHWQIASCGTPCNSVRAVPSQTALTPAARQTPTPWFAAICSPRAGFVGRLLGLDNCLVFSAHCSSQSSA